MDRYKYNWEMTEGKSQTSSEFLGIEMNYIDDGKVFKMNQDCLINDILKNFGIEDCEYRLTLNSVVALQGTDSLVNEANIQDEYIYFSLTMIHFPLFYSQLGGDVTNTDHRLGEN